MCWLHHGRSVDHVLALSEAKEGSQQPHAWLEGCMAGRMEQNLFVFSGKRERKDELNIALSFVSLIAGSRL